MHMQNSAKKSPSGLHYFLLGWKLIFTPGIKRFVFIPLLVNILLMGCALWWLFEKMNGWIGTLLSWVPDWLHWLSYLLSPLFVIAVLLTFCYFFSTLTHWISAPFNGLLSEQLEIKLTGQSPPDSTLLSIVKDIPRMLAREMHKTLYCLPRFLMLWLLLFIPVIGSVVAPVLLFLFGAWMQAIQYCDYPFDNHKVPFLTMRKALQVKRFSNIQFGALVNLCTVTPILNMIIVPVAVCGATAMWVDRYKADITLPNHQDLTLTD